jgi:tetratricopeptide (TPR) repeat protein
MGGAFVSRTSRWPAAVRLAFAALAALAAVATCAAPVQAEESYAASARAGRAAFQTKDLAAAEQHFQSALRLAASDQERTTAWYSLGVIAQHRGRPEEARQRAERALALSPADKRARKLLDELQVATAPPRMVAKPSEPSAPAAQAPPTAVSPPPPVIVAGPRPEARASAPAQVQSAPTEQAAARPAAAMPPPAPAALPAPPASEPAAASAPRGSEPEAPLPERVERRPLPDVAEPAAGREPATPAPRGATAPAGEARPARQLAQAPTREPVKQAQVPQAPQKSAPMRPAEHKSFAPDPTLPLMLAGGACVLLLVALLGFIAARRRRAQRRELAEWVRSERPASAAPAPAPVWALPGPLPQLTFMQSLDSSRFAQAAEGSARNALLACISSSGATAARNALDAIGLVRAGLRAFAPTTSEEQGMLEVGNALAEGVLAGGPEAAAGPGGELAFELAGRVASSGAGNLAGASTLATVAPALAPTLPVIVVGAALTLAVVKVASSLKRVEGKLDQILAVRRIDQTAALERIYASARELLLGRPDERKVFELWRLRGELRELRAALRLELDKLFSAIKDPSERGLLARWRKSATEQEISDEIGKGETQIAMLEYALRLDQVLAAAGNTWQVSLISLADELAEIAKVGALLAEKTDLIHGEERLAAVLPLREAVAEIVHGYCRLLPPQPASEAIARLSIRPAATLVLAAAPHSAGRPRRRFWHRKG